MSPPPPVTDLPTSITNWLRRNLFNTWYNSLLTVVCLWVIGQTAWGLIHWGFTVAQWRVIAANLPLFWVGRYPPALYGRMWVALAIVLLLGTLTAVTAGGWPPVQWVRRWLSWLWVLSFPVLLWLIGGGLGLRPVPTNLWNGLVLTLLAAVVSIALSFPLGVLLALGRQSDLPVVRWGCIAYIELIRGLPLIGILFIAQIMLPLLMPTGVRPDRVGRAIAGLTLFSAAYLAENVRGGLQAIPKGQVEAARALGLNPLLVVWLIVLPQALRAVIPAIVGQFIGLFKDTSLLAIVGLVELTGIARSILAQPQFLGRYAEVYLFIGLIYWLFCYTMSWISRKLERDLGVGHRV